MLLGGVVLGLVVGKPLGVILASMIALRTRIGLLPVGMTMRHIVVLGMVAGVGFTMSLFIAQLAFLDGPTLAVAKLGVLVASGAAAMIALIVGRLTLSRVADDAAATADEAESSNVL
jgi:NhaA family Na+:H+ antiporter